MKINDYGNILATLTLSALIAVACGDDSGEDTGGDGGAATSEGAATDDGNDDGANESTAGSASGGGEGSEGGDGTTSSAGESDDGNDDDGTTEGADDGGASTGGSDGSGDTGPSDTGLDPMPVSPEDCEMFCLMQVECGATIEIPQCSAECMDFGDVTNVCNPAYAAMVDCVVSIGWECNLVAEFVNGDPYAPGIFTCKAEKLAFAECVDAL